MRLRTPAAVADGRWKYHAILSSLRRVQPARTSNLAHVTATGVRRIAAKTTISHLVVNLTCRLLPERDELLTQLTDNKITRLHFASGFRGSRHGKNEL